MPRRVEFDWVDSAAHQGPWDEHDAIVANVERVGALNCHTVGYLIHEDDDTVTIAQSVTYDLNRLSLLGHAMTIPRVAIVGKMRDLRR